MNEMYLLKTEGAKRLYEGYAKDLPIIDYHNHVAVSDLVSDRRFSDMTELWLASDPYKHRLMRICGIEEHFITGDASHFEKFEKFCSVLPYLAGNPVYDWAKMELSRIFGINALPSKENAKYLYNKCAEMLASPEFSNNAILSRFGVEYQSPVASLTDDLVPFSAASVAPSLRGDNLLSPSEELKKELEKQTSLPVTDTTSYVKAVCVLLDRFDKAGCRFADHALDHGFFENDADGARAEMLGRLGGEYAKRGWTLLLHIGAKRKTSERLLRLAGPAGGYAAAGDSFPLAKLCDLLGAMEAKGALPDTVVFPLNMNDQAPLAVMQGSFAEDGTPSKVALGPAWWWCDHAFGIENTLSCVSSFGALSQFIGMTTDSRSILSFVRHDYFRRLLCNFLDARNTACDWELPTDIMGEIIKKVCYGNAKAKITR